MSTDIAEPDANDSPLVTLPGRLIGFGVTTAQYTRGTDKQITRLQIVINGCNCVGSSFIPENPPVPMRIVAGVDPEIVQTLGYRDNVIEKWYGQDCGGQQVDLIAQISPTPLDI